MNCSGPAHLLSFASKLDYGTLIPSIMPNAGYPEQENEVLVYSGMPKYFAEKLAEAPGSGFRILGGRDIFRGDPFLCGCAFNVNSRNISEELYRLDKKIGSGASFVLTQSVFSGQAIEALKSARGRLAAGARLFAGILTPLSYKNARFLANEIPGIVLPQVV